MRFADGLVILAAIKKDLERNVETWKTMGADNEYTNVMVIFK